jgi:hypothetical protein
MIRWPNLNRQLFTGPEYHDRHPVPVPTAGEGSHSEDTRADGRAVAV